ncbi:MAG: formate dehydrogenase-N subunit alpha [Rhodocyclaceae bacterium]|nr:MAG: formate dehydrogenase-N subunit alpha [Rhodocyclaceae bacterium]
MTNHWVDIKNTDLVFVMGGNPAEAHPCGFKWVIEAKKHRKAKLVVVDPRFNRTASVADFYAPIRPGSDIAFLSGVINYLLSNDKIHHEYVKHYTNASFLIDERFALEDGLFSGYNAEKRTYDKESWKYQFDKDGYAKVDETLEDPNCVFQVMKKHYARYTPDVVAKITGTPKEAFLKVCEYIAETAAPNKTMTNLYALGWTEHSVGTQNIRSMAIIQQLLGNMGMAGGGINALRGHSNVQGITDMCLYSDALPGYLGAPLDSDLDRKGYLEKRTPKAMRPNQMNFPQNYPKWWTSLMKSWYGKEATPENDFCYDWLPKKDVSYDVLAMFDRMYQGKMSGFVCQGFNPLASVANKKKVGDALAKLKYLVIMDPLITETSEFWKNHGEVNPADPASIQTEVFRLPVAFFAEEAGTCTNSGRVVRWHWKAVEGPGDSKSDAEIMAHLYQTLKAMYAKDGGAFPDPILKLSWPYRIANDPSPEELLMEISGKALADLYDPKDATKLQVKGGDQLASFGFLRDDGSTACGNWIYSGCWSQAGNLTARRDSSDPSGLGQTLNWGFAWPVNRRIIYNRASCDLAGKPWDPSRTVIKWLGDKWGGNDVPDMRPDAKPEEGVMPFIMNPEGVARLFARDLVVDGPLPEHYEPFESPLGTNPMHPKNAKAKSNPVSRVFKGDLEVFGTAKDFPYVATTYRLTEHFHFWTQHSKINAILQPEHFVELGEELAKEKGIKAGDKVKVRSNRGYIKAVAVVTKRIKALEVNGQKVHTIGIPINSGFTGQTKPGFLTNTLTPAVGDANTHTPEYKAFLVNIEKA